MNIVDTAPFRHWAHTPPHSRIYAIGDIHGRLDLLTQLEGLIVDDAATGPQNKTVIYLGDYIDRGPDSGGVIDHLLDHPLAGFKGIRLMGNHEDFLINFLENGEQGSSWIANGGDATLEYYGITAWPYMTDGQLKPLRSKLENLVPPRHRDFLAALYVSYKLGDYVFVHAGVRPGVQLADQDETDLMWIREIFLKSNADFGHCVVHGHSIADEPEIRRNRIGIDTGAYRTGRLTCVVLEDDNVRFLQT